MKRVLMWALSLLATMVAYRVLAVMLVGVAHRIYLLLTLPLF